MRYCLLLVGFVVAGFEARAGEPARDNYLMPLPKGAKARLGMTADRANNTTHSPSAAAPDGKLLATPIGGRVFIWEQPTGKIVNSFEAHVYQIRGLAFFDNDTLLTQGRSDKGFHDEVKKWHARTGKLLGAFNAPENWAGTAFARDGKLLAVTTAGGPNTLHVLDTVTGKEVFRDKEHYPVLFFSPDDKYVVSSRQERIAAANYTTVVTFREARTGNVFRKLELKETQASITDLSPDGRYLVGHTHFPNPIQDKWRNRVQLFDAETGKLIRTFLEQRSGDMKAAVFSPDGKLLAAYNDTEKDISVWQVETGAKVWTFPNDSSFFNFPRFAKDGKTLVNTTSAGRVFVHDLTTGATHDLNPTHRGQLTCLAFSPDGKHLASASHLSEIMLWETATGKLVNRCEVTPVYNGDGNRNWGYALKMAFAPDGKHLLAQQGDQTVRLYAPFKGREVRAFREAGYVWGFSDDGRDLMWTGVRLDLLQTLRSRPQTVARDDINVWLGTASWIAYAALYPELQQFRCRQYFSPPLKDEDAPKRPVDFLRAYGFGSAPQGLSPDGSIMATWIMNLAGNPSSGMGTYWVRSGLVLWDVASGQEIMRAQGNDFANAGQFTFAPDSRSILGLAGDAQSRYSLRLYETRTGKLRLRISDHVAQYGNIAFSRDGRWLVFLNDKNAIEIFDLSRGKTAATIPQAETNVRFAFSSDGSMLASGGHSGTVLLWDLNALVKRDFNEPAWTDDDQARLWNDLAHADAEKAYEAMMRLKRSPEQALALIRARLQWHEANKDIGKLIERLGSADFKSRKAASDAIEQLGERARPLLVKAIAQSTSLEHKRRVEGLLENLGKPFTTPVGLRILRSIEVLDALRTPEAARLLREIAADAAPDDPLAREVTRALGR